MYDKESVSGDGNAANLLHKQERASENLMPTVRKLRTVTRNPDKVDAARLDKRIREANATYQAASARRNRPTNRPYRPGLIRP